MDSGESERVDVTWRGVQCHVTVTQQNTQMGHASSSESHPPQWPQEISEKPTTAYRSRIGHDLILPHRVLPTLASAVCMTFAHLDLHSRRAAVGSLQQCQLLRCHVSCCLPLSITGPIPSSFNLHPIIPTAVNGRGEDPQNFLPSFLPPPHCCPVSAALLWCGPAGAVRPSSTLWDGGVVCRSPRHLPHPP